MMGTTQISLCVFLGCFIAVQSVLYHNGRFTQDFVGVYENRLPFSFERNIDFSPQSTIFSSWRSWTPDFHRLAGFSSFLNVPRVQVYCDASTLTVLVDKRVSGFKLTGEEMQLGNGCFSNGDLANEFVFTYGFDECGTTPVVEDDMEVFTNTLFLNLRRISPTWWKTPSAVHVYCVAKRLNNIPKFSVATLPENDEHVNIKAMSSSWTSAAQSNVYRRGQVVNLQVLAKTGTNQQAFIQSCFVSVSPEPRAKPRQTVLFNKGCITPLGSSTTIVTFVASNRADVVNFVMNTSYLISELYIHCSVLISGQGVTPGSKSCNYNVIESRWEELSGDLEACECCSSRCKGNNLPGDAKTVVSTGPFIIVDVEGDRTPLPSISKQETSNVPNSMQPALPDPADVTVSSAASVPRSKLMDGPEGVVVVSQDPATRLTLWLPEQVPPQSAGVIKKLVPNSNDIPELHSSTIDQEPYPNPTDEIKGQNFSSLSPSTMNLPTMVNGWKIPAQPAIPDNFKRKSRSGRSGNFDSKEEPVDFSLPAEISVKYLMMVERPNPAESDNTAAVEESQSEKWLKNEIKDPNRDDPPQMLTDGAVMPEGTPEIPPIMRSKLTFSKAADGSQTLSYEEEAVVRKRPAERNQLKLKGLRSTFLNLLRRMKNAD